MMDCGENDSNQMKNRLGMDGNYIVLLEIDSVWMQERWVSNVRNMYLAGEYVGLVGEYFGEP